MHNEETFAMNIELGSSIRFAAIANKMGKLVASNLIQESKGS
jgi:hypothetical protein